MGTVYEESMLGEIVAGVTVSGLTGAARALADALRAKIRLQGVVYRAYSGTDVATVDRFTSELLGAFGQQGQLSETVDATLRRLSVSGLTSHLVMCAAWDIEPKHGLAMIAYCYLSSGGDSIEDANVFASRLFRIITEALAAESRLSAKHSIADLVRNDRSAERRVRRHEAALASIVADYLTIEREGGPVDALEFASSRLKQRNEATTFHDIALNVLSNVDEVDVHSVDGAVVRVPLSDVYVEPPLFAVTKNGMFFQYRDMRGGRRQSQRRIGWSGFLALVDRTVLLGDPGGGKSTLSKKICTELALAASKGGTLLPIFVRLRSYAAQKAQNSALTVTDFMVATWREYTPEVPEDDLRTLLSYWLQVGQCFVVFDGLDEVLTVGNRASVSAEIREFAVRYPLSRFLVTSRFVGYESTSLPEFEHFGVGELDDDCISELFDKIHVGIVKGLPRTGTERKVAFIKEANERASELITNPLLLTLIIIVHSRRREIPDNRSDLYAHCAELLFERWDGYRNITPHLPERYRLYDLLMHISSLLMDRAELGGRMSKTDLLTVARDFFVDDYVDNKVGRASEAAKLLVDHLVGRSWILHEVGENVFEFTHRTFLEFFYARHLETRYESVETLIKAILQTVEDGSRSVSAHLSLQMKCKDKRTISTKAAVALSEFLEATPLQSGLHFCVDTIEYLLPSADVLRRYVRAIALRTITQSNGQALVRILSSKSPLNETVFSSALDAIGEIASIAKLKALNGVFEYVCSDEQDARLVGFRQILNETVIKRVSREQARSAYALRLVFSMGGEVDWNAARSHGSRFWSDAGVDHYRWDVRAQLIERVMIELSGVQISPDWRYRKVGIASLGGRILPRTIRQSSSHARSKGPSVVPYEKYGAVLDRDVVSRALMLWCEIELDGPQSPWIVDAYRWLKQYETDPAVDGKAFLEEWMTGSFSFLVKDTGFRNRRGILERFIEVVDRQPAKIDF